ncbi:MAG: glycosyltransferase [Flavobacteriales bacterium]
MSEPTVFCFFPLASVGGTERVHLDVLNALSEYSVNIFIRYRVNPWKGMSYKKTLEGKKEGIQLKSEFEAFGRLIFLSDYLEAPRFGRWIKAWYIKRLVKKINACSNPIVIFWHRESIDFIWDFLAPHVKLIDIVHNNSNNESSDAHYLLNDWAPRINQRVLVNRGLRKWILTLYDVAAYPTVFESRMTVINHTVTIPNELPVKSNTVFNVLFVGRDATEKRIDLWLEIAQRLAHLPLIQFHLVGIERIKSNNVNLTSYGLLTDPTEIQSLYSRSHTLVLTSQSEGFPKVIAEAMAFGCVPIVTAVGAIPEVLSEDAGAMLTNPLNCVEETIEKLHRLSLAVDEFNHRSKKAYFYAKDQFEIERFNAEWRALIQNLG